MKNPFSLSFGKVPINYISRLAQTEEIVMDITSDNPTNYVYMICGVRGAGKTVMLSTIESEIAKNKEWITVELNVDRDMLNTLIAKLYSLPELKKYFIQAKLDISSLGIGVSISQSEAVYDVEIALEKMLGIIRKHKKKLLITVDEVVSNKHMKVFAGSFQILIRKNLPVFCVMTGLYDNINKLQDEKSLTFLYRAPKTILEPLSINAVARSYKEIFGISDEEAYEMAVLTKGYPFAYQVLGYVKWKRGEVVLDNIIPEFEQYLEEYVYEKIWSELSIKDREIMLAIPKDDKVKIKDLRDLLGMNSGEFSVYRKRLERKGLVDVSYYGYISASLPRFCEIVRNWR